MSLRVKALHFYKVRRVKVTKHKQEKFLIEKGKECTINEFYLFKILILEIAKYKVQVLKTLMCTNLFPKT